MSRIMMFASDQPLKGVDLPPDFAIHIDTKLSTVDDGGMDDGFEVCPSGGYLEIKTDKKYFAELFFWDYTPGRAKRIIEYIREHLKIAGELELWNVWLDNAFDHRVRKRYVPIDALTVDTLREIHRIPVGKDPAERRPHCRGQIDLSEWEEPTIDCCYVITAPKGSSCKPLN